MSQVDWNNSDFQLYENGTPLCNRKKKKKPSYICRFGGKTRSTELVYIQISP